MPLPQLLDFMTGRKLACLQTSRYNKLQMLCGLTTLGWVNLIEARLKLTLGASCRILYAAKSEGRTAPKDLNARFRCRQRHKNEPRMSARPDIRILQPILRSEESTYQRIIISRFGNAGRLVEM
jgi:hypothetical protein